MQTVVTVNGQTGPTVVPAPLEIEAAVVDGLSSDARFIRGDSNADGRVDIADTVTTLRLLFRSRRPFRCLDAADADGDGAVGISDAILVVRHQFLGGTPPVAPYPGCGRGAQEALGCREGPDACAGDRGAQ